MKYVDINAIERLFGKILPFSIDYFARHVDKLLLDINNGSLRPEFKSAADVLLANNRENKTGTWDLYKEYDFDIFANYVPYEDRLGGKLYANLLIESKTKSEINKLDWRVMYRLRVSNKFNGTPWEIEFPLQVIMKYYPHKAKGDYMGYCHSLAFLDENNKTTLEYDSTKTLGKATNEYYKTKDEYTYVGVTKRNWLTRMAEHFREINSGSNKTFHQAWRNHIGRRDILLVSQLVVTNHTLDEIMHWEEAMVDQCMEAGKSLNMIPGGFKGMRFLHEHRHTKSPRVSLKEYERAKQDYQKQHPRAGIPNLLISELWKDPDWAAKAVCSQENRLSQEQVRAIRQLGDEGLTPEEITERVGARNVRQVNGVLNGDTYQTVH